jgi:hypothetical protein
MAYNRTYIMYLFQLGIWSPTHPDPAILCANYNLKGERGYLSLKAKSTDEITCYSWLPGPTIH